MVGHLSFSHLRKIAFIKRKPAANALANGRNFRVLFRTGLFKVGLRKGDRLGRGLDWGFFLPRYQHIYTYEYILERGQKLAPNQMTDYASDHCVYSV